jgi:hypothetical protein
LVVSKKEEEYFVKKKKLIKLLNDAGDDMSTALNVAEKMKGMVFIKSKVVKKQENFLVEEFTFKCKHCNKEFSADLFVESGKAIAYPKICLHCGTKFDFKPYINEGIDV